MKFNKAWIFICRYLLISSTNEIATLATLRLILRANRGDPLIGGGRWKVNVPEEEVRRIAGSIGFSLNDHLVD
jgi:Origin recognition complex (ORC) subunit 5 C-terminus